MMMFISLVSTMYSARGQILCLPELPAFFLVVLLCGIPSGGFALA